MRVLVACEESQVVCTAFRNRGHEAYSCDIQEPSGGHPEWHIHGDAIQALQGGEITTMDGRVHIIPRFGWDLVIAHPPCTFLSNAGACRLYPHKGQLSWERFSNGLKGKLFFMVFYLYGSTLALRMKSKADFELQIREYCAKRYICCEIYRMLMDSKYEEESI